MDKSEYKLISRIDDFIDLALYKQVVSTTHFLNPSEQSLAIHKLKSVHGIKYNIEGGYKTSERNIIIIYPDNEYLELDNYLALVEIQFTKFDTKYINHRMILGSILSLGIKRDGIGDIIINDNKAYIIATKQMAEYVDKHLLKVSRAHVSTTYIDNANSINLDLKEPITVTGTVASLRVDCILALALKTSRSKAGDLIKNQTVFVNWQLVTKSTQQIQENDIITVRKKGRAILKNVGDVSRKNRIRVELEIMK